MSSQSAQAAHGVLIVDKPRGPTSHDLVARVRRALGTRAVGHAGTLDPMATGVLVVLVGEAAKLSAYLTADDKRYDATVRLGAETRTLDAEGEVTQTAPVPSLTREQVERALVAFEGETQQLAPIVSAIKRAGQPLHQRARRGERVDAPVRTVVLHHAQVLGVDVLAGEGDAPTRTELRLRLHVGKGFYVRSLARDLARALGTVGHLSALRRTASGAFALGVEATTPTVDGVLLEAAARGDAAARASVREALVPLTRACEVLPSVTLSEPGVRAARTGLALTALDFADGTLPDDPGVGRVLVARAPDTTPVALVRPALDGTFEVARGFVPASR